MKQISIFIKLPKRATNVELFTRSVMYKSILDKNYLENLSDDSDFSEGSNLIIKELQF